jgi:hypothetical protein
MKGKVLNFTPTTIAFNVIAMEASMRMRLQCFLAPSMVNPQYASKKLEFGLERES